MEKRLVEEQRESNLQQDWKENGEIYWEILLFESPAQTADIKSQRKTRKY